MTIFNARCVVIGIGCLVLSLVTALANPILVNNPSFETLPPGGLPIGCGPGCSYSIAAIPGWNNGGNSGQFQPGVQAGYFAYFNTLSDGPTSAYTNQLSISQTVGATVQF